MTGTACPAWRAFFALAAETETYVPGSVGAALPCRVCVVASCAGGSKLRREGKEALALCAGWQSDKKAGCVKPLCCGCSEVFCAVAFISFL